MSSAMIRTILGLSPAAAAWEAEFKHSSANTIDFNNLSNSIA